ncbi:MAG: hypothetical protein U0930_11905 [Pirellulales bacterium]
MTHATANQTATISTQRSKPTGKLSSEISFNPQANSANETSKPCAVVPSIIPDNSTNPFTLDQELEVFGKWSSKPIFVPPKNASSKFARYLLNRFGLLSSRQECWSALFKEFAAQFQQVREIQMSKASIRLPQGKLFVSITPREQFDQIEEKVPSCVLTRLQEFLDGPGKQPGVKVYYLKPLCIEVGDQLMFTSRTEIDAAIKLIQDEVFTCYNKLYPFYRPAALCRQAISILAQIPVDVYKFFERRRQQVIDAYQAKLEFQRRKLALRACKTHQKLRTHGCTFDEMLDLTNPLQRTDVVTQYCNEQQYSIEARNRLLKGGLLSMPWFVVLAVGIANIPTFTVSLAPPMVMCDPAFVAEFPDAPGVLMKIGHFDIVGGIPHIEL